MRETNLSLEEKAKHYALECHHSTAHTYDGKPYSFHLEMVVAAANDFIHLVPKEKIPVVLAACWVHDCIEDCRQTYNDVKDATNTEVAEIAYALTNEKGKTRKERANEKYYEGIRNTPLATFAKLCDRIANVRHSLITGGTKLEMYVREMPNFEGKLYDPAYEEMFAFLRSVKGGMVTQ